MTEKENYHHGDLRQTIIEEALAWIDKKDISSLSLRKIARHIGVSHNAPYRHFPDKENLLVVIAKTGFIKLHQALKEASEKNLNDIPTRLETIGVAYVQYAINNRAYYRVMFSDGLRDSQKYPKLEQVSDAAFNVLLDVVQAGQEAKVFSGEDSLQLACVCWSLVHGVSMLAIDNQLMISNYSSIVELAQLATKTVSKGMRV